VSYPIASRTLNQLSPPTLVMSSSKTSCCFLVVFHAYFLRHCHTFALSLSLSLSLYLAMVVTCGFGFGIVGHFTCSQKLVQRGFASSHVHDLRLRPIYYVYLNNLTKCTFGYSLLKREVIGKQLLCKKIFFIKTWFS